MSHVAMPAKEVRKRCREFLLREHNRVLDMQEPLIQKAMKPKLFGLIPGKTREQATAHLECNASKFDRYHLARLSGCIEVSKVQDLLALAELAGERTVMVSEDVARYIS
jgi:hypothetical protein